MLLKWHESVMHEFESESAVATALRTNTEDQLKRFGLESGVFLLSGVPKKPPERLEQTAAAQSTARPKASEPPVFAFLIIRPGGRTAPLWLSLAYVFGRSFLACLFLSLMLSWTMRLDYLQRVIFCVLGGVFASLVADVPMLIWLEAPVRYIFINFADHLCEWTLVGIVIAMIIEGRDVWERMR
jgi:hypothetical protein